MNADPLREDGLDPEGFLHENTDWSREVARELAERNDLGPISKDQWRIIDFVRGYFAKFGEGPPIMKIAKATGLTSKQICSCFPCGVAKGAYRLAGLPKPSGCL